MLKFLFPDFEDKNIQVKHNTLISYALFLIVLTFFTGYATYNVGPNKVVFFTSTLISLLIPVLVIIFSRKNFGLVSNLVISVTWISSSVFLLLMHGDNSVNAFLIADLFIISVLASLTIRWYVGIIYGFASIFIGAVDLTLEKLEILNIFHLEPIPTWAYFIGITIMLGTLLIVAMTNALSFEKVFKSYNDELKKRIKAEDLLKNQNFALDEKVNERTEELAAINEELVSTNEELYIQHKELEEALTNLQNAQKHLVQNEKMASLGILSAGVAHEINNPLNFISGGIQGIESYLNDKLIDHQENLRPLIEAVNTGVHRAADIVKSLNRFSRQTDSSDEACDLHTIINNCLVMLQNQTKDKISITKQFTDVSFTIKGNEGKLHQVILNILTNAIQAVKGVGTIKISTNLKNESVVLQIQDSGQGIEKELLSRIFDPFFTTKEPGKGTGLGLAICYQIIQSFNGNIEIQSETGKGTTAIITLPIE